MRSTAAGWKELKTVTLAAGVAVAEAPGAVGTAGVVGGAAGDAGEGTVAPDVGAAGFVAEEAVDTRRRARVAAGAEVDGVAVAVAVAGSGHGRTRAWWEKELVRVTRGMPRME